MPLINKKDIMMLTSKGSLNILQKVRPYFYIVLQQLFLAGMYVLAESTLKEGMNQSVLVVYRNIVGVIVVSPFAFWFERKHMPRITMVIFFKITALALLDPVLQQNSFYFGAKWTSASFASALENIIPAITYLMVLALRLEIFEISRRFCQAKVVGTIANVAGAIILILYKGPNLTLSWHFKTKDEQYSTIENSMSHEEGSSKWIEGTFSLLASSTFWSAFLILQSNTLESFPAELTLTVLICIMGAMMSSLVALVSQNGSASPWILGWDNRLFVAIYSGITCTGVSYYLQGAVMKEKGPVFVGAFTPVTVIFTMAMGSFFLFEKITLGMIIGVIIMVAGLYALLWGYSKDQLCHHNVRVPEEVELPISTSLMAANCQTTCESIVLDNTKSVSEGQSQEA